MHLSKPLEEWTQEQLIAEIRFLGGIVKQGEGRELAEGEPISEALLAYVRRLEAKPQKVVMRGHQVNDLLNYLLSGKDGIELSDVAVAITDRQPFTERPGGHEYPAGLYAFLLEHPNNEVQEPTCEEDFWRLYGPLGLEESAS